ncbi:MAG TPA: hypothetical protein VGB73_05080 [Pyrinomonadaceae bacterium]|jgi:glucose/arabinose dehydrogenase
MSIFVRAGEAGRKFFERGTKGFGLVSLKKFCLMLALSAATSVASAGCQSSSGSQGKDAGRTASTKEAADSQKQSAEEKPAPQARVLEDEAMLKGSQAIIGGKVQNISDSDFAGLTVEIELKRRQDGTTETRRAEVEPQKLAPGEQGRYSLSVSREWSSARLVRLYSTTEGKQIVYVSERGALRPPERIENKPKVVVIPRPRPKGEEFINTPDTADRVP